MSNFYVNKHPLGGVYDRETNKQVLIPIGTIFSIDYILCNDIFLKPVSKIKHLEFPINVSVQVLKMAFNEQEYIVEVKDE